MGCDRGLADTTLGTGHQHCLHALPPDRRNDPRGYTGPETAATAQPRGLPAAVVYPLQGNRRHGAWSWKGVGVARSGAGEAPWDARDDRTAAGAPALRDERPDRSEEHTSELQSLMRLSHAVFCLNKKNNKIPQ